MNKQQTELMSTTDNNNTTDIEVANQSGMPFKTIIGETASELTKILMDNIQRVQTNPEFVPQAKEVRDNVRELVNLARVEIDMIREARKVVGTKSQKQ